MASRKYFFALSITLCLLLSSVAYAEEGMFLLKDLQKIGLEAKGLKIPVSQVYSASQPSISERFVRLARGFDSDQSSRRLRRSSENQHTWKRFHS
jgi:hypothetical protein